MFHLALHLPVDLVMRNGGRIILSREGNSLFCILGSPTFSLLVSLLFKPEPASTLVCVPFRVFGDQGGHGLGPFRSPTKNSLISIEVDFQEM